MDFNKDYFKKNQKTLLRWANAWYLKWLLGLNRLPKKLKIQHIDKISPASIHWKTGKKIRKEVHLKGFRPKEVWVEEWKMIAFTRPRFAEALTYNLSPFVYFQQPFKQPKFRFSPVGALGLLFSVLFGQGFWFIGITEEYPSGAGDGRVYRNENATWALAHDTLDGNTAFPSDARNDAPGRFVVRTSTGNYRIDRHFFPIDTSELPEDADITVANFYVWVWGIADQNNDGDDFINVVQTFQANPATLGIGDYDECGDEITDPTEGATRIDLTAGFTIDQYNAFTLNATGRGWISKTGWTKLGLREGHDIKNNGSIGGNNTTNGIILSFSEETGSDNDPYLEITYTIPIINIQKSLGYAVLTTPSAKTKSLQYCIAEVLRPNSTELQGITNLVDTSHHGAVSDENDDTNVNTEGVGEEKDRYGLPDSSAKGVITNVRLYNRCQQHWTNEQDGHAQGFLYISTTEYNGVLRHLPIIGGYITNYDDWAQNPDTSEDWTWDDIDALEIGIKLTEEMATYNVYCAELWIVVTYTPIDTYKIEKSLGYKVKSNIKVQKNLKYCVEQTPSAITKSLKYTVKITPTKITKSLEYVLSGVPINIEKTLKYVLKTTPSAITKTLGYNIYLGATAIQKSLLYAVSKATAITKELIYKVLPSIAINKSLKYTTTATPSAKQKSLKYTTVITPAAKTKSLKYSIFLGATAIEKSLSYSVKRIVVKIDNVDKSDLINFASLEVQNNLYSKSDSCYFTYEKFGNRTYVPAGGDEIIVLDRDVKIFGGKITSVKVRVKGKVLIYDVECKDWVDQLDGELVSETYENQTVNQIIADLKSKYATTFDITNVNCTTTIEAIYFDMKPMSKCLDELAEIVGYHWYVNPDKKIYFFVEGSLTSPFDVTDTNGKCLTQSLEIAEDYEQIKNRVNIQGGSIANVQVYDAASIAAYGEHEIIIRDDTLTSTDEATQKANAILAAYKDPLKKGGFQTYDAGLVAGQRININSALRGVNQDFIIQSVRFRAKTPIDFIYSVRVMTQQDQGLIDLFQQKIMKPSAVSTFGNRDFVCDIKFSIINYHKIEWEAGTITMSNGEIYNIAAGDREFTNTEICYFKPSTSETVLQFSTTFGDGAGDDRIALGYAIPNPNTAKGAQFIPKGFMGGVRFWGGENIVARTIIADQIGLQALTSDLVTTGEFITLAAQIKNAIIGDAHITGTITVGKTDADVTGDNPQNYNWISGSKPPIDADNTQDELDLGASIDNAKANGITFISGGYINTGIITADNIITGTLIGRTIQTAPNSNFRLEMRSTTEGAIPNALVFVSASNLDMARIIGDVSGGIGIYSQTLDTTFVYLGSAGSVGLTINNKGVGHIVPMVTNTYNLGSSARYWGDLYLSAGGEIYVGSSTHFLRLNQRDFTTHDAVGFDNLGDTLPEGTGIWDLGNASHKFNLYYGGVTACDLPTYNHALTVLKKIEKPKVLEGHFGTRQYFEEDKFPSEIKYIDKRSGKELIEGFHMLGFLVEVARELYKKIEELEKKVGK